MPGLAEISSKLVGVKFKHCSSDSKSGYDCFTSIVQYLNFLGAGITFDTIFEGVSFDYISEYAADPHGTMELAHKYIASITTEVKRGFEHPGDILILKTKKKESAPLHLGIDGGNGVVIVAVKDKDIRVLSKNSL